MDGFADAERPLPGGHFREQFRPVLRRHDERIGRVFHFSQIDDSVRAVEREVDLSARLAVRPLRNPRGIDVGRDARNAEGRLDLRNVVEAELLEGQPAPRETDRRGDAGPRRAWRQGLRGRATRGFAERASAAMDRCGIFSFRSGWGSCRIRGRSRESRDDWP